MAVDADWARDGRTHDSGSLISGLTSLDDDTDEFGRIVVQHVRDEQRLNSALNRNGQAFRKARPNLRIANALDHLEMTPERRSISSVGSDPGIAEHTLTKGSPPLNVPRDWGRKARHNNDWLRRLGLEDDEQHPPRPASANAIDTHKELPQSVGHDFVDWAAVADRPVRSIEAETPLPSKDRQNIHSPEASSRSNTSIDRIRQWELEQDFTAGSILQSTPAMYPRSARMQELERIQSRAIATDRLSRISERETPESIKERLESRLSRTAAQPVRRRRRTSPDTKLVNGTATMANGKENMPAIGVKQEPRTSHDVGGIDGASPQAVRETKSRPTNARNDSLQLLKRLARVTSQSPSPDVADKAVHTTHTTQAQSTADKSRPRQSSAHAPEAVPIAQGVEFIQETPRISATLPAKTPKVMGAWVDTPFTTRHESAQPSLPKPETLPSQLPSTIEPFTATSANAPEPVLLERAASAPPSALHNLLHPSGPANPALNLGDETLASLEGLLDPTATLNELSATLQLDSLHAELAELHAVGRPLTQADTERKDELLALESMGARLRAARKGVREVGRGLRDVERRVDGFVELEGKTGGATTCEVCRRGVWRAAANETWALFVRPGRGMTWLGTLTLAGMAWWVLEFTACEMYCRQEYATTMIGYGVDPFAPEFPFVLPTLLFRPFEWAWGPLLWIISTFAQAAWSYLSIPFEDDPLPSSSPAPFAKVNPSFVPPVREQWSEPRRSAEHPPPSEDFQLRQLREQFGGDTMEEDSVIDTPARKSGRFGFAKLWSWTKSPAESADEVRRETVATRDDWAEAEASRRDYWSREDDVKIVDTAGLWETGEGMSADEVL
ncbi:hypothetical protein K461DRAFT_267923 [Myriangium duriaei CBS 260.36]|uniref:Uncharacterized protein n=1 Tax=Myriangium duriaei CBS 260.36 TaxID=1168546 RepID=A0A9P4MG91_9PEZI|nr:hypothetical protein K461DRAFT_267923 [Myriangium duriaei CBS 260.36]